MNKLFMSKIMPSKIIGIGIVYLPLIFLLLNANEYNLSMKITFIIMFTILVLGILLLFVKFNKKKILIVNGFLIYMIPYDEIKFLSMGYKTIKGIDIPSIVIWSQKYDETKTGYLYYQHYKRETVIKIINYLKRKNNSITLCNDIETFMNGSDIKL